jgi:tetratricopeptide (TPR) repeat protein
MKSRYLLLAVILIAGTVMCVLSASNAYRTNGEFGFPLDDAWIHLQFAKNLHDYGAFSYYKNEMVTSGSTSPLYTMILAVGFFLTNNEMLLSYVLGVMFFLLAAVYLLKIAEELFNNIIIAGGATLLFLLEPRLQWIALSGMETTLFIFLLLATLYYYRRQNALLLGIGSGLLLWTRPEAILFLVVLTADAIYHSRIVKQVTAKKKSVQQLPNAFSWMKKSLIIAAIFGCAYIGFNLWLSGSILPNTFAAKLKYYAVDKENFALQVYHFLSDGHLQIVAILVLVQSLVLLYLLIQRKPQSLFVPFAWSAVLFLAYWKNLPYLYQEGRYMMPILPFFILLAVGGVVTLLDLARKMLPALTRARTTSVVIGVVLILANVQFAVAAWEHRTVYQEYCHYILDRQVRTGKWLHDHLPENAIVGTHDVGAIAFYSGRRIADMVGLISPEMINNIGSLDKLRSFLIKKKATHIAVLRNWFEITNENVLFQTDEQHPEIMEVFAFDQARTHFTPQNVTHMIEGGQYYFSLGNVNQAGKLFDQALRIDPQSSKAHYWMGKALLSINQIDKAEAEFKTALTLYPEYLDAQSGLAEVSAIRNKQLTSGAQK